VDNWLKQNKGFSWTGQWTKEGVITVAVVTDTYEKTSWVLLY